MSKISGKVGIRVPVQGLPRFIKSVGTNNIVEYQGVFYSIPQALGPLELEKTDVSGFPGVVTSDNLGDLINTQTSPINKRLARTNLFEKTDDEPILVVLDCPTTACNYRCPYCFHMPDGFHFYQEAFDQWRTLLETTLNKIKRPLLLCIGPQGEPVVIPQFWKPFRDAVQKSHVISASL